MLGGIKIWIKGGQYIIMENYLTSNENFAPDNTLCSSCMFRTELLGKWGCGYILYTDMVRNCSPTNCKKYKKGKRRQISGQNGFIHKFSEDTEYFQSSHKYIYDDIFDVVHDIGKCKYYDSYNKYY